MAIVHSGHRALSSSDLLRSQHDYLGLSSGVVPSRDLSRDFSRDLSRDLSRDFRELKCTKMRR